MFDRLLSTIVVVSRIPLKGRFKFDSSRMDFYLPITGILPALLGLCVLWAVSFITDNPFLIAIPVLIAQYLCFNLFHLDGLADTADAFLGAFDREKRHAILKDSRIGVYGAFAVFAALSLKVALLAGLLPLIHRFPAAILAYPLTGRFSAALIPCMAKPANPGGLGVLVQNSRFRRVPPGLLLGLVLWLLITRLLEALAALIPSPLGPFPDSVLPAALILLLPQLAAFLTALFYARLYRRGLGGYTGDALGAAIETAEILHLVTALIVLAVI